jgi:ATP-binding cassette subfamily B protein
MKKKKERSTVSWVLEFAGQKKSMYIYSVIMAFLGAVFQMFPYLVIARMIQKLLDGNRDFQGYVVDTLAMVVIWFLRVVFHAVSTGTSHVATFEVLGNIRKRGLDKLARMPLGDVKERGSGELKNILVERIDSVETTLAHIIPEVSSNLFVVIAMLIYLFVLDWRMALASLITFPIGMLCYMGMMIGYDENYQRTIKAVKNLNDTAVEYIEGIEVIKVFGKAKSSYEKFVEAAKEGAASYVDWMRKCNVFHVFAMNIMPATLISVLPIGGILVRNGSLTVNDLILIIIIAMGLITPIISCANYGDDILKLRTVMQEIVAIIDAEEMNRPMKNEAEPIGNTIQLSKVRFGYDEKEVLHGIDLTLQEGTVNAFVGPSGGGKSTIAKLIASYWDVGSGKITIGGVDIRKLSMEDYQKRVAYVSQDNFLFDDTIRENIRLGNLSATDDEVEKAAQKCGCYDFIMSLEKGFDTIVGSGGGHLSGGERQRICIARAMLKDAPIIILDEATAYTDPENEAIIQTSVAKLVQGRTLIVIAHRLSTIVDADQIVVVEQGKLDAIGTHEELLKKSNLYRKLWEAHVISKDCLEGGEVYA